MQFRNLALAIGWALVLAACGQSGSDNVMVPDSRPLDPNIVDSALGPEVTNTAGNSSNDVNAAGAAADSPPAEPAPATNNATD